VAAHEFKNCTIYLIGFPGVGKLSVAKEICKQADFRMIDSHAINKLVFPLVRRDGKSVLPPEIWTVTRKIRQIVLETMVELGDREFNLVFTNVLLEGEEKDLNAYKQLESAVDSRGGCLIPVRLLCDQTEHLDRIIRPEREIDWKLTDGSRVALYHEQKEPFKPPHPHAMTIDVTNLSAAQAAEQILEFAAAKFVEWSLARSPS